MICNLADTETIMPDIQEKKNFTRLPANQNYALKHYRKNMVTASIVTYRHHLLDIEPVLRSLLASPVDRIYIIDHSADILKSLEDELTQFKNRVLTGEPQLKAKVDQGLRIDYIRHDNNGYGGGNNVALQMAKEAGSTYHLVVNPDIWFGPRVIPALISYMDEHREVGQMMPKVLYPDGSIQPLAKMLPTPMDMFGRLCLPERLIMKRNNRFELRHSEFRMTLNVPFLSGCFMFLRMSAVDQIGMFDERFFLYAEDIDFTRRMHSRYKTVYYPEVPVYHKFSRASRRDFRLFFVHICSVMKYFNKWGWFDDPQRLSFNKELNNYIKTQLDQR